MTKKKVDEPDYEEAAKLLDVKLPTTMNALKQGYKRASMKYHPDHNRAQDAAEQFQRVKAALDLLSASEHLEFSADDARNLKTENGIALSTLGKGLGPLTNGATCPECDARGFSVYTVGMEDCGDCRDEFVNVFFTIRVLRCRKCNGSGTFKNKGKCFACNGAGWMRPKHRHDNCRTCNGLGRVEKRNGQKVYNVCGKCKGCGELPMWNPVLPKGLLAR